MKELDLIKELELEEKEVDRRKFLKLMGMMGGTLILTSFSPLTIARAKEVYPADAITWIVYAKGGGGFDISARGMAPYLSKHLKEVSPGAKGGEVIVKNVTQGGGRKAYTDVYNAKPDGYTIGYYNMGHIYTFGFTSEKLPFDQKSFTWLFATSKYSRCIISNKKGLATWEEMLAASKKAPLKWVVGAFGGSMQLESIIVKEVIGVPAKLITTGATAETINAILRGDGQVALESTDSVKPLVDAKEVNVLVTFTEERIYPQVPTIKEKGFPQLLDYVGGHRLVVGPPNLDPEAKRILIAAAKKVMSDPEYLAFSEKTGYTPSLLFGKEVEELINRVIKFYQDMAPILGKYLA